MASKRISRSAIDWKRFQSLVQPHEQPQFQQFLGRSYQYASKVAALPENLPKIDFDAYKKQISSKSALIDKFQTAYSSVQVQYPKDVDNVHAKINAQEKESAAEIQEFLGALGKQAVELQKEKEKLTSLPPLEELTVELQEYYFPSKPKTNDELFGECPHAKMLEDAKKAKLLGHKDHH